MSVNALVVRVVEQFGADGGFTLGLGVSPFLILALFVAARLSFSRNGAALPSSWPVDSLALLLTLIPSSAASWLVLALYAGLHAWHSSGERRLGALLFLALAVASLWSSVVLKSISGPVTAGEAYLVGKALALIRPDIVQLGNVVGNPEAHNLILMTQCSTADIVPIALVSLAAVTLLLGRLTPARFLKAGAALVVLCAFANLLRLCATAWSSEAYGLVHGPIGANMFDAIQAVLVLGLGEWASRS